MSSGVIASRALPVASNRAYLLRVATFLLGTLFACEEASYMGFNFGG